MESMPAKVKYHSSIPLDPSLYDAIYSTMSFVKQQIKQNRICCTSLTFYLPLFRKAPEVKVDKSPEFDRIYLKLGGFQKLISFMGAGSKLMQDAGLKEVWLTIYKENSFPKMLNRTSYSCSLRACQLTDAVLHFALLSGNNHCQESKENQIFEPTQFFLLGFTPCKAKQPLRGMQLQERKQKKDYRIQKICLERTYS